MGRIITRFKDYGIATCKSRNNLPRRHGNREVPCCDYTTHTDWHAEGLLIEGWPVQFLPVADGLDAEALAEAQEIELEINSSESPVKTWILRAEHVVAIALKVGRMKDRLRILQFLEEEAVAISKLRSVLVRNGLGEKWQTFCRQAAIVDPCQTKDRP